MLPIYLMSRKLISLGAVAREEWIVQASLFSNTILVVMYNTQTGYYTMQYLRDEYEANMFIEYVIEKGEL